MLINSAVCKETLYLIIQSSLTSARREGGGNESNAFVVEGLGLALDVFEHMDTTRINKKYVNSKKLTFLTIGDTNKTNNLESSMHFKTLFIARVKVSKICLLIGHNAPYLAPCEYNLKFWGYSCEALAKVMSDRDIKLSVMSARKSEPLKKIFEAVSSHRFCCYIVHSER